jgi:hypothetical protein
MADVKVGDVRRPPPERWEGRHEVYLLPEFEVLRADPGEGWGVRYVDERQERHLLAVDVERCPLWPSEHEEWKDARGYEMGP